MADKIVSVEDAREVLRSSADRQFRSYAHTVVELTAQICRQSLDYLSLDGQAIELQDKLREVEAERDAANARADAAEAKVRAVEAVRDRWNGGRARDVKLAGYALGLALSDSVVPSASSETPSARTASDYGFNYGVDSADWS